jgi:hypothetical protein
MDLEIYSNPVVACAIVWSSTNRLVRNAHLAMLARRRDDRKDLSVERSSDLRGKYARPPNSNMRYA